MKLSVPVVFRKAEGKVTPLTNCCSKNVPFHVFLFCAKASGDRNETPATRTSRKRNARVGRCETPARVAKSKQGGGYRAGDPRLVACFRAHAGFRAGWLMHPGIHFRRKFRCKFHSGLCITRLMAKQIIIIRQALCQPDPPPICEESSSIDRNFEFYIWPVSLLTSASEGVARGC